MKTQTKAQMQARIEELLRQVNVLFDHNQNLAKSLREYKDTIRMGGTISVGMAMRANRVLRESAKH